MSNISLNLHGSPQGVADLLTSIFRGPLSATLESLEPTVSMFNAEASVPAIGDVWPGQGGIYAGVSRGVDGQPDAHLIMAEKVPETDLAWDAAVEWAQRVTVEGHVDFRLPTRAESALLFANVKDKCEARWHWTGEQYSRTTAWYQYFDDGFQYIIGKSFVGRARAVRRFIP